jgi:hypothetical protein
MCVGYNSQQMKHSLCNNERVTEQKHYSARPLGYSRFRSHSVCSHKRSTMRFSPCSFVAKATLFAALCGLSSATELKLDAGSLVDTSPYVLTGNSKSYQMKPRQIAATEEDLMYTTHQGGKDFTYSFQVECGTYTVKLGFAETYTPLCAVGKRVFDIAIQGQTVASGFDAFASAGSCYKAVQTHYDNIKVTNGVLNVHFNSTVQYAFVSTIDITMLPPPRAVPATNVSEDCGSQSDIDEHVTGISRKSISRASVVTGTMNPARFLSHRYGKDFIYTYAIQNGEYSVTLGFSEQVDQLCSARRRVFDVTIQNETVLPLFDVYEAGGCHSAVVKTFHDIMVTDGMMKLRFTAHVNNAMVSLIEIAPDATSLSTVMLAVGSKGERTALVSQTTSTVYNMGEATIFGTRDEESYRLHRAGDHFEYSFSVQSGEYQVKLGFAEAYPPLCHIGVRMFNITVGSTTLANFDAFEAGGGIACRKAVIQTFDNVVVTDGTLKLTFASVRQKAFVSTISIMPAVDGASKLMLSLDAGSNSDVDSPDAAYVLGGASRTYQLPYRPIENNSKPAAEVMYQSHRAGRDFSYEWTIPSGMYNVRLGFAETYFCAEGKRVFTARVQNAVVAGARDLDVVAAAGGCNRVLWLTSPGMIVGQDGKLKISFLATKDKAMISAIEVERV